VTLSCCVTEGDNTGEPDSRDDRDSNGQSDARQRPNNDPGTGNTCPKRKYTSDKLSRFEVAIDKGDYKLVSELARRELTLEDYIDGFVTLWRRFGFPAGKILDFLIVYHTLQFSRYATIKQLGMTLRELELILEGLSNRLGLPDGATIEQSIDGFIHLWRRLGCPEGEQINWMLVYKTLGFDRKAAAAELEMTKIGFKLKLHRFKKECNIRERSAKAG